MFFFIFNNDHRLQMLWKQLDHQLQMFWKREVNGSRKFTIDEIDCDNFFEETINSRNADDKFVVRLLFKSLKLQYSNTVSTIQDHLVGILLGSRKNCVASSANIFRMNRMMILNVNYQRILWRFNSNDKKI